VSGKRLTKSVAHQDGRKGYDRGLNAAQCPYPYTEWEKVWCGGWWERFWEVNGTDLGPPSSWGYHPKVTAQP